MSTISTIAIKEVKTTLRNPSFLFMTALFVLLSIISVFIGTSTKNAVIQVVQNIEALLQNNNSSALLNVYPLAVLGNIITYINMLGAVVAIYLGYEQISREKRQGTYKLLITRPIYRDQIISGKILGAAIVLVLLLLFILVFNILLFLFVTGIGFSLAEFIKFFMYFVFAFIYLMFFYVLSLFISIKFKDSEYGFLFLMLIWMIITYVIPSLAASQRNFSSFVNAATQSVSTVPTDTLLSTSIEFLSPSTQLQHIGNDLLQLNATSINDSAFSILSNHGLAILMIISPTLVFTALSYISIQKESHV